MWQLTRRSLLILTVYNTLICLFHGPLNVRVLDIPWQPVALLGTAVAFYIGFKSDGSHNWFWEGRQLMVLVSWVLNVIEGVGHTSENSFENDINDVPMTAICRSIEIDLRELLEEVELPPKIEAVNDVLY